MVQQVDVTEEVNRRLRESRLRRLMETPRTSQKRKYDAFEDYGSEGTVEAEEEGLKSWCSGSEFERTPTKRLKSSGTFEQLGKRKDNDHLRENEKEELDPREDFKRRRV